MRGSRAPSPQVAAPIQAGLHSIVFRPEVVSHEARGSTNPTRPTFNSEMSVAPGAWWLGVA